MKRTRVLILGAAGRDFHNFNTVFRGDRSCEVVAFTAQQIPHIARRRYPPELAGELYPDGIPIRDESELEQLIRERAIDLCLLSYSDLAHTEVMHLASRCNASGAAFTLLGARQTMLQSTLPVIAVTAARTGAGKSQVSRAIAQTLRGANRRVAILRHPMPYGDLARQRVQRFASAADLDRHQVTIEEREEYEPHIAAGSVVWAGVDYGAILCAAEREADVLIWDGGNNDTPFLVADLHITVLDPHRAGHELSYYPGETNLRMADLLLINKVDTARAEDVQQVKDNAQRINPRALVIEARSSITVDQPELLRQRRVLAIEDGPTVTHGGMKYGAAFIAARSLGGAMVDPRAFAVGEIAETFRKYPDIGPLLPAMGYGTAQLHDLQVTIANAGQAGVEAIAIGTPIDLAALIDIPLPHTRVRYSLELAGPRTMSELLTRFLSAPARPSPEAAMKSEIEKSKWSSELQAFTKRNMGRSTVLEEHAPDLGAQEVEHDYPLRGVAYDDRDDRIEIMLGTRTGAEHFTRSIGQVRALEVLASSAGLDEALRIMHDGAQTVLSFRQPPCCEPQ